MPRLIELVPDLDTLLALAPEQLGECLLSLAETHIQANGMFLPDYVTGSEALYGRGISDRPYYPRQNQREVAIAIGEAWHWLEINMLIMPADGFNGSNGWKVFTRRGARVLQEENAFRDYAAAANFPKSMLHPLLGNDVWLELAQGHLADAVFKAFRTVEEQVRDAGGFSNADIGASLMRDAFNKERGPLTRPEDEEGEREGLGHLFAGAIQSYKNPHSHRTVTIEDVREAQEMLVLASHLLRIVDARRQKPVA